MVVGATKQLLKENPPLIPLFGIIGLGLVGAGYYVGRLSMGSHVVWDRKNPHPWIHTRQDDHDKFIDLRDERKKIMDAKAGNNSQ
ncbi:hypothetical protein CAOG_08899 [Capsaspora owczarzaki ATCC 30864]|uniref:Uncharacterized protein n=1 Tax=Capsaspora owczarzaki (strain ATCC 30864) TaxID=595528 RepID=A0A0D2WSE2_CAPO3|nr:hypothetical protein CAOG_08899 [Capsaspora owczarzaki ATCC 30864]KJE95050.1 hypothetical protein CAOG_008899 [Capsaspora owczarzaki ATCC 30864]|eukprot:XP_011270561.1 hypothetical protein CAOG_08899 [Capsaspora owczarzaki ATCC 30864]